MIKTHITKWLVVISCVSETTKVKRPEKKRFQMNWKILNSKGFFERDKKATTYNIKKEDHCEMN